MTALDTICDEFNYSLESIAAEIVFLQHSLEELAKRMETFLYPRVLHNGHIEMTVRGAVDVNHFESALILARQTPGVRLVILYIPRTQFDEKLGMISQTGFHVGGSRVEDGIGYTQMRRYI